MLLIFLESVANEEVGAPITVVGGAVREYRKTRGRSTPAGPFVKAQIVRIKEGTNDRRHVFGQFSTRKYIFLFSNAALFGPHTLPFLGLILFLLRSNRALKAYTGSVLRPRFLQYHWFVSLSSQSSRRAVCSLGNTCVHSLLRLLCSFSAPNMHKLVHSTPTLCFFFPGDPLSHWHEKRRRARRRFGQFWVRDQQHNADSPGDLVQNEANGKMYNLLAICQQRVQGMVLKKLSLVG